MMVDDDDVQASIPIYSGLSTLASACARPVPTRRQCSTAHSPAGSSGGRRADCCRFHACWKGNMCETVFQTFPVFLPEGSSKTSCSPTGGRATLCCPFPDRLCRRLRQSWPNCLLPKTRTFPAQWLVVMGRRMRSTIGAGDGHAFRPGPDILRLQSASTTTEGRSQDVPPVLLVQAEQADCCRKALSLHSSCGR